MKRATRKQRYKAGLETHSPPSRRNNAKLGRLLLSLTEEISDKIDEKVARRARKTARASTQSRQERHKAEIEYIKHATALATGAILLIVTFLEKLFQKPMWKPLVVISLFLFLFSVLSSVAYFTLLIPNFGKKGNDISDNEQKIMSAAMLGALASSFFGLLLMAVFASVNLLCGELGKPAGKL